MAYVMQTSCKLFNGQKGLFNVKLVKIKKRRCFVFLLLPLSCRRCLLFFFYFMHRFHDIHDQRQRTKCAELWNPKVINGEEGRERGKEIWLNTKKSAISSVACETINVWFYSLFFLLIFFLFPPPPLFTSHSLAKIGA